MSRIALAVVIVFFVALPNSQAAPKRQRKVACKTPSNAQSCYWTRGRLGFYNGTPAFRLWKVGTHRMLGIYSGPSSDYGDDNEHPEFPTNIQRMFRPTYNRIFADFEVCPLEPEHAHSMQAACIETAKNVFIENLR